ncbi:complement C1s subcomponent [Platysternon megacephalum]|uniref:Complement C1s subcomponent n=1 Tax=Platysternon megacephalum TaxID=55544 RepID=A0A4D9DJL1_9SAUR|nr:complement C1s subcomponent [Platysternon megacephalum]
MDCVELSVSLLLHRRLTGRESERETAETRTLCLYLPQTVPGMETLRGGRCDMVRGRVGMSPGWSLHLMALWTLYGVAGAQPSITAQYGADITLDCTFHHIPGVKLHRLNITWKMQRAEGAALLVHSYYGQRDLWQGQDKVYRGRTQLDPEGIHKGNASLRLRAVRFQDEGSYLCYVTSELGASSQQISLAVLRESEMESPIVAQQGQDVTLSCPFECGLNLQPLNVTWKKEEAEEPDLLVHSYYNGMDTLQRQDVTYKGRTQLHPESFPQGNASLTLRRVRSQDEGLYICHVKPELGRFSVRMQVTVEGFVSDQPSPVLYYVFMGLVALLIIILCIIIKKCRPSLLWRFRIFQFWSQQNQQEGRDQPESNPLKANESEKPNTFLSPPASSFPETDLNSQTHGAVTIRRPGGSRVMKPGSRRETYSFPAPWVKYCVFHALEVYNQISQWH